MFSFRYVLRETGQNLWRNILLAVATVVTVGVSLAMFGGFMLFQVAVDSATARWQDGVEFIVWMNTDAGTDEDSSVRNQLDESPGVERWEYVDRLQSYEEFKEFFEDTPEVLEIFTAEGVPPYYRVVPTDPDPDGVEELGSQFKGKPGVRTVTFAGDVIRDVQNLSNRAGRVLFIGSIVLLGASTLLILNTLAVAIGNRRPEIEIMRLVGATKWFIRVPFMLEGLVQGLLGAIVAMISNSLLRNYVIDQFSDADGLQLLAGFKVDDAAMLQVNLLVVAIAVGVAVIGSNLAVAMHLNE
ncbi:MAG: FtsX-like permease family protein [Acidimicrobiaceae bacterium]|nr:permease-like cell division protein FtsX [Acidimicrobiaceae bacterium]MDE0517333.1 permease-like cell division protein FtsX [Acidimicrobiaceae bacterium]MXZ96836.1 FtsX-like permease family protein [Acidimicrobiaceae bacterium]MYF43011.1 FtsX-like permease family protein [Acidimicrobiaceae bacterium]MYJ36053.1 FtsX-like permease family protein [Acidimicrobiaceae bacterium]